MGYEIYLDNIRLPIAPESIRVKVPNNNESIKLANDEEFIFIKTNGFRQISFDVLLPNDEYPFSTYERGYRGSLYFTEHLKGFKQSKQSLKLKIIRRKPSGKFLFDDIFEVVLEDYEIKEDASENFDVIVSLNFKEYKNILAENVKKKGKVIENEVARDAKSSPEPKTTQSYTVKKGDTLWGLAKKFYGDGSKFTIIEEANKDTIKNKNLIYVGQVLKIPKK